MSGATPWVIAIAAVAVAVRLRRRRKGRPARSATHRGGAFGGLFGVTGLVAAREVRVRVRGRIFRAGTLLILAGVAAAIVIPVLNRSKHTEQVGVVGALSAPLRAAALADAARIRATVRVVPEASLDAAREDLRSGRISFAIVDAGALLVNKAITSGDSSTKAQLVRAISETFGTDRAVKAAGLTAAQVAQLAHATPLQVESLQPAPANSTKRSASVIGLILLFVMLNQYNTWTLIGVMEEKSSRVAEVLLSAVRPWQLLAGKVLGIAAIVFGQAALIVGFALALGKAVGSNLLHGTTPLALLSTLVWLVLGYAFYSWVYAAAGSMASRQDQIQTLALPLSLPILVGYIYGLTTAASGSPSVLFDVLAYLPPTAPFAMPVLVGLGKATWWEFAVSALISIVCTVGVARLAASIYRRAILRTGQRVQLRELLSGRLR